MGSKVASPGAAVAISVSHSSRTRFSSARESNAAILSCKSIQFRITFSTDLTRFNLQIHKLICIFAIFFFFFFFWGGGGGGTNIFFSFASSNGLLHKTRKCVYETLCPQLVSHFQDVKMSKND